MRQGVILAAGKGIRVRPLTSTRPKPLLKIQGKTFLEYNLEAILPFVDEVILVIGYKGEMIKNFIGSRYKNLKIKYVWQKKLLGTGDAAQKTKNLIKDKFLLLHSDDFYSRDDIKKCLKKFPSILLSRMENPACFGQIIKEKDYVKDLVEKPKTVLSNFVNCGCYFLDRSVFNPKIEKSERGEYEFTDYIKNLIKKRKLYFQIAKNWFPVSYPWHLLDANRLLFEKIKNFRQGKIEKNCRISGKAIIEKGVKIKSGSYIEGPVYIGENSQLGPNCYIRGLSSIGKNCHIGQGVEIKNSIIGDNSKISHLSYIGDSIIGDNCNFGAGTILANFRFDSKTIKTKICGKIVDTGLKKFGSVIGDNVKTGIHCSLMPGILIGANSIIGPETLVKENIEDNTTLYSKLPVIKKKISDKK